MDPKTNQSRSKLILALVIVAVVIVIAVVLAVVLVTFLPGPKKAEKPISVQVGNTPVTLKANTLYSLPISPSGQVYMLGQAPSDDTKVHFTPAARSYDGNNWEALFPLLFNFDCDKTSCVVKTPEGSSYTIVPVSAPKRTDEELVSDYLIQSTFGPNRATIASFPTGTDFTTRATQFVKSQIAVPPTSHRAYFRQRANALIPSVIQSGTVINPCDVGSRWERIALDALDVGYDLSLNGSKLFVNGEFRTEVDNRVVTLLTNTTGPWYVCPISSPQNAIYAQVSYYLSTQNSSSCNARYFPMPAINFTTTLPPATNIAFQNGDISPTNPYIPNVGLLKTVPQSCKNPTTGTVFATDSNGVWYKYSPRLRLVSNTVEQPFNDPKAIWQKPAYNPNVPKNFVNEPGCIPVVSNSPTTTYVSTNFILSDTVLRQFYQLSGLYTYFVTGLTVSAGPCTTLTARFRRMDPSFTCTPGSASTAALNYLTGLIAARDVGRIVVDIPTNQSSNCSSLPAGFQMLINGTCWLHVHPNEYNVYDFTQWTLVHPGGNVAIQQFAENNLVQLRFPPNHDMYRWEGNYGTFPLLGIYNSTVNFLSLPAFVQTYEMAQYLGALQVLNASFTALEKCGSSGEVANNPVLGNRYGVYISEWYDMYNYTGVSGNAKYYVWENIALYGQDQLRQRVAWALAQIFVVTTVQVDTGSSTEPWAAYYDIFVNNAFGNYFDIMKQVSYSPLMGIMLTYLGSYSYQRAVEANGVGNYPDENYARELMQLFTIGLWKLNQNGTYVYQNGVLVPTYSNYEIESFARIWTGFGVQNFRGNLESSQNTGNTNYVDIMKITATNRDTFPKHGLDDEHIGDTYPLCRDLPSRSFLRTGAKYRFLGSVGTPFINANPSNLTLDTNSQLYALLCNAGSNGQCQFASSVILSQNLQCYGTECSVDTVRVVRVLFSQNNYIYYEYVQVPCVELEFPELPTTTTTTGVNNPICIDKRSIRAAAACCKVNSTIAYAYKKYDGEISSYDTASSVCSNLGLNLCSYTSIQNTSLLYRFWSTIPCSVQAQVYSDGRIGINHVYNLPKTTYYGLKPNSNIVWRVNWVGGKYPNVIQGCDSNCITNGTTCICNVTVKSTALYTEKKSIPDAATIVNSLFIGAPNISMYDQGTYTQYYKNKDSTVIVYVDSTGQLNTNSILQVTLPGSRVLYLFNKQSTVSIGTSFSFRNPPNFMMHEERTVRDATYEVDALLYHLLYQQNTAPFVSSFMINRFVSSNPSPNYIQAVSTAFITGSYNGIGSGVYGDMAATIAAVLLYRDATSSAIKSDASHGQIRDPMVKLIHFMRAFELTTTYNREVDLKNLNGYMGIQPHSSPSVFNFYQSNFQPFGAVTDIGLYAPEAEILTPPNMLTTLNAYFTIIQLGLSSCYYTFGTSMLSANCNNQLAGTVNTSLYQSGYLNFWNILSGLNASQMVDKIDLLLSGGRLDPRRKDIMLQAYNYTSNITNGISLIRNPVLSVVELFAATPEFQVTSTVPTTGIKRPTATLATGSYNENDYQAVVYIFLVGGADSYNLIVPMDQCGATDLYQQYANIRTNNAILKSQLLPINTTSQPCRVFGVNPNMPFTRQLYNSGEAAFISNVGNLVKPLTVEQVLKKGSTLPYGLYAHNIQQQLTRNLNARDMSSKGILGRIHDAMTKQGRVAQSYSVSGTFSAVLEGSGISPPQQILNPNSGITTFDKYNQTVIYDYVRNLTVEVSTSIYGDTWNDYLKSNAEISGTLNNIVNAATMPANFANFKSGFSNSIGYVARLIAARADLQATAHLFNVELGGFDTHNSLTDYGKNMGLVDSTLQVFVNELKRQNVWDKVTIVVASEFGRTMGSNGAGTDHAWGGNTFIMGGSVKGGQIHGQYPANLADGGGTSVGNGRMLPTTPNEAIWNGVCQWLKIDDNKLNTILPNRANFLNGTYLFSSAQMFK